MVPPGGGSSIRPWLAGLALVGVGVGAYLLARGGDPAREVRDELAADLATRIFPRTGLTLAKAVEGGIHDLETDTTCKFSISYRFSHRLAERDASCRTSRVTFKDGRGRALAFNVGSRGWFDGFYLTPADDQARAVLSRAMGRAFTSSPLSEFVAYDKWLAEVRSRWKGLASSIVESRSPPGLDVEAVVRVLGEGGRPLVAVSSGFSADTSVIGGPLYEATSRVVWKKPAPGSDVHPVEQAEKDFLAALPLARPSYKLGGLRFTFADEQFFARHGATIIADALTPHCRDADWKKEAATIVSDTLRMLERCRASTIDCSTEVDLETARWWPRVVVEKTQQELRVTIPGDR